MYKNCNAGKHVPCSAEKTHVAYVFTIEKLSDWLLDTRNSGRAFFCFLT